MYVAYCANPACGRRHESRTSLSRVDCFDCGASLEPAPPFFGFLFGKSIPAEDVFLTLFCVGTFAVGLICLAFLGGL